MGIRKEFLEIYTEFGHAQRYIQRVNCKTNFFNNLQLTVHLFFLSYKVVVMQYDPVSVYLLRAHLFLCLSVLSVLIVVT
jgi:hypothetical protein